MDRRTNTNNYVTSKEGRGKMEVIMVAMVAILKILPIQKIHIGVSTVQAFLDCRSNGGSQ